MSALDRVIQPVAAAVRRLPSGIRNILHGTWLGHPLHPALAYIPAGAWTSAAVLDVVAAAQRDPARRAGTEQSASLLVGLGLATAPVTAAAGAADWSELNPDQQRIGAVHAAANGVAVALFGGSLLLRRRGRHGLGRVLGLAGAGVAGGSAAIGGHLSFHYAAGANHAEDVANVTPGGWHHIGRLEEFPDGGLWRRVIGETPVVVLRRGSDVRVLADRCSHLSGPLNEGELSQVNGEDCVSCPWHGSTFRFSDGGVVSGPATAPQPRFDVRVEGGAVSARIPE